MYIYINGIIIIFRPCLHVLPQYIDLPKLAQLAPTLNYDTARKQMCRARRELSKATIETIWIGLHDELFTVEATDFRYTWASSWSSQIEVQVEVRASEDDVNMCN